jgi:hypothetical protein
MKSAVSIRWDLDWIKSHHRRALRAEGLVERPNRVRSGPVGIVSKDPQTIPT